MEKNSTVPRHVAIIMDGNGRWAQARGEERLVGHSNAIPAVKDAIKGALEAGIGVLSLYAFSLENWGRPSEEVDGLMELIGSCITNEIDELDANGVRVSYIGEASKLRPETREMLDSAAERTRNNKKMRLVVALSYGSRQEIVNMTTRIASKVRSGELTLGEIDEKTVSDNLYTSDIPDPDLLIRTSGEQRISNFMLWQIAYAELFFTDVLWPDFRKEHLFEAIDEYARRNRRFGLVTNESAKDENI